jgi:hypothetical protein
MSTEYLSGTTESDHDLTLAIPGEIDSVRRRLIDAIQQLGYKILGEQPIYAKRGKQHAAKWDCSVNVLDYPTTLTVALKQTNDVAVVATFNYEVNSYMCMTKGDRQTLAREAEAIAALATERLAISACGACGTRITDESNFCRRCGAPTVLDLPELEVLRLTRGSRDSYHNIFVGLVTLVLASLTALPLFIVSGARITAPLFWVGIPLASLALIAILKGSWQLHQTLNPKPLKTGAAKTTPAFTASVTKGLPAPSANDSVTEGTTELLTPGRKVHEVEPVRRKDQNTAELDNERLM